MIAVIVLLAIAAVIAIGASTAHANAPRRDAGPQTAQAEPPERARDVDGS